MYESSTSTKTTKKLPDFLDYYFDLLNYIQSRKVRLEQFKQARNVILNNFSNLNRTKPKRHTKKIGKYIVEKNERTSENEEHEWKSINFKFCHKSVRVVTAK